MFATSAPSLLELFAGRFQCGDQVIIESFLVRNPLEQRRLPRAQKLRKLRLELLDSFHSYIGHVAVLHGPDHCDLNLERNGTVLRLLEDLDDSFSGIDLGLRLGIELRSKLCKCRQLAK